MLLRSATRGLNRHKYLQHLCMEDFYQEVIYEI